MERKIRAAISGFQGTVRLYAKDLGTDGRARCDETLALREEDKVSGSGVLREFSTGLKLRCATSST
jgi:hypothetical protein